MGLTNNVSIELSKETVDNILKSISDIRNNLPKLITLSNEQRQLLPKMGNKTVAFVSKSFEYAQQNPQVVPKFLDVAEFKKDVDAVNNLFQILAPLQKLAEELDDTIMLAGSEAYASSRSFYSALKNALNSGETGLKNVYDDLSTRFPSRSAKKVTPEV